MKHLGKNFAVMSAAVALSASTASAGTLLKLNAGTINPQHVLQTYSTESATTEYIVQFKKAIQESDKKALLAQHFEIFGYLPDDALVVRASGAALHRYQQTNSGINAVIAYAPAYKISGDFNAASVFNKDSRTQILIKTFKASESTQIAQAISALNSDITVHVADGNSIVVTAPRGMVANIANVSGVEHVQPNQKMQLFHFEVGAGGIVSAQTAGDYSDINGTETGTKSMNFDGAWAMGFTGKNQIASMSDTGLDTGDMSSLASDFNGAILSGYPFGLWSKSWEDPMGHGTHVAGSIVSRGTHSNGLIKGGAYDAKFVAESMWSPMLKNLSVPSKLGDLFTKAYGDGARVHSNSWGGAQTFGTYDNYAQQVDEWMFNNPDMLILFAAGNSGADLDKDGRIDPNTMSSPGTAKNVLTVGASKNKTATGGIQVPISKLRAAKDEWSAEPIYSSSLSDNDGGLAMFSSRGPTSDGRTKPDIVAPGTNILSTRSHVKDASPLWGAYNDDYAWSGGTSMATPLTAGAVTVARQILTEKLGVQNPSAALMKAVMLHTADELFPGQFGEVGAAHGQELLTHRPNSDEGYGRVDVANIAHLGAATKLVDNRQGVATGQSVSYNFTVAQGGSVYANLVWTDAPGSSNASVALVNDLDLVLTMPNGQTVSMNDHINNLEMIEQTGLAAGNYTLTVKGNNVPSGLNGAQPYALVYTAK
jgi:subtilisin family serine protease